MPRASRLCPHPDCPHPQPCPDHARKAWQGSTRRQQLPLDWNQRRAHVLARDLTCTICHTEPSAEVHHTGDRHDHRLDQLAGVCASCHRLETQQQSARARAANRA